MKFSKKKPDYKTTEHKPDKVWNKSSIVFDISKFNILWDESLPRGKFQGRALRYIYEQEVWYYGWLIKEGLLLDWGLVEPKITSVPKKSTIGFISSTGEYWLGLREVEVSGAGVSSCYL